MPDKQLSKIAATISLFSGLSIAWMMWQHPGQPQDLKGIATFAVAPAVFYTGTAIGSIKVNR